MLLAKRGPRNLARTSVATINACAFTLQGLHTRVLSPDKVHPASSGSTGGGRLLRSHRRQYMYGSVAGTVRWGMREEHRELQYRGGAGRERSLKGRNSPNRRGRAGTCCTFCTPPWGPSRSSVARLRACVGSIRDYEFRASVALWHRGKAALLVNEQRHAPEATLLSARMGLFVCYNQVD